MASGSNSAAEMVGPKWEVGPTEDVVQALMETLVDPLLPSRVFNVPPSEHVQKSVANQMHAVVLLYNYYHRKQKPELVYLDFVYFCNLAMVVRPSLVAFMKLMKESKPMEPNVAEDQLSVTEKAIKDACDIAVALDTSRDVPNTEGWPISEVAILLIDSKKENCMLQFGNVTKGAWSLIKKELNESCINLDISAEEKVGNKRKRNDQMTSAYDTEFLQLGYDAVKDVTGINSCNLEVLESHITYSLSKEKSATRFYMMQCPGSINVNEQVPLKFLVESLQGPLAEKFASGNWKTTPVVEYHHLLPYEEFISCWLSRFDLCLPSLSNRNAQSIMNGCEELTQCRKSALNVLNYHGNDLDQTDNNTFQMEANSSDKTATEGCGINNMCEYSPCGKVGSPVNMFQSTAKDVDATDKSDTRCDSRNRILENIANDSKQPDNGLLSCPSISLSETVVKVDNAMEELKKGCDIADPAMKMARKISAEIPDNDCDDQKGFVSGPVIDDNVTEKFNEKHDDIAHSVQKDETRIYPEILDKDSVGCDRDISSSSSRGLKATTMSDSANICTNNEDMSTKLNSKIRVYHHRRKTNSSTQNDAQHREDGSNLKVDVVDHLKTDHTQRTDEKVSGDNGDVTNTCSQPGNATGKQIAQFEATIKHNVEIQGASASDQLQNALALLYRKRQELYSRICNMEDTLALCEDNITRIRDGSEVELARQCIKSFISGHYHPLVEHGAQVEDIGNQQGANNRKSQHEKHTRLSESYLPGKSPCQDLEYTCQQNNWRLPRYVTESSNGKFLSNVVIEGKDFKLHAKGSFESKPSDARDSAAAQMIAIIRNTGV